MRRLTGFVVVLVVLQPAVAGVVFADTAIAQQSHDLGLTIDEDGVGDDSDGDGYYDEVSLVFSADTETGEFGGGEPYLKVFVNDTRIRPSQYGSSNILEERPDFRTTIFLQSSEIANLTKGPQRVRVELWEDDFVTDDKLGEVTVTVPMEPEAADTPVRQAATEGIDAIMPIYASAQEQGFNPEYWEGVSQDRTEVAVEIGVDAVGGEITPGPIDLLEVPGAGAYSLGMQLMDLTEQGVYMVAAFQAQRDATVLEMAAQENTEFRRSLERLRENHREIDEEVDQDGDGDFDEADERQLYRERQRLLREAYGTLETYERETRRVIERGESWGVLDVCESDPDDSLFTSFFVALCDRSVDIDEDQLRDFENATGDLKTVMRADWRWTNAWLANSTEYGIEPLSGQATAEPRPEITVVEVPDTVVPGETVTVRVETTNDGANASVQTIAVSFPDGISRDAVTAVGDNFGVESPSTPADGYRMLLTEGETVGARYGTETIPLQYPLFEVGNEVPADESRYLELEVTIPEDYTADTFSLQIKSVARGDDWVSDPAVGATDAIDQQGEFVREETIQVYADRDDDGIRDGIDECPDSAEDADGVADDDGCPDGDIRATIDGRTTVAVGESLTLDASGTSVDPATDGSLSYEWEVVSQPQGASVAPPTGVTGDVSLPVAGTYEFRVTVTSDRGGSDTARLTVTAQNEAPTVTAFTLSAAGSDQLQVAFDSSEPLGQVTVEITDASGATVATLSRDDFSTDGGTYTATTTQLPAGEYTATLTDAVDDSGASADAGQSGTATLDGASPTAAAASDGSPTDDGSYEVTLDAGATSDPDTPASDLTYEWSVTAPNGASSVPTPSGQGGTVELRTPGTYEFGVTVSDPAGNTDTATTTVTVPEASDDPDETDSESPDQNDNTTAPEVVDSCTVIDEPGTYELTGDLDTSGPGPCIHVRASDVTLDGNGYTLSGDGVEDSIGLLVYNGSAEGFEDNEPLTNVTVRDLTIREFERGVRAGPTLDNGGPRVRFVDLTVGSAGGITLFGADDSVLRNVTATDGENGLYLWETSNVTGENLTITDNTEVGLFFAQVVEGSRFSDLTVRNNTGGVYFSTDTVDNRVTDASVLNNGEYGVSFSDSRENLFAQSTISGTDGPAVLVDNSRRDRVEDVEVRNADGVVFEVRSDSEIGFANVLIGPRVSVSTPDDGSAVTFQGDSDDPMQLRATPVADFDGDVPGRALTERVIAVSNADSNVVVTFTPDPADDADRQQLFRLTGDQWAPIDGAAGSPLTLTLDGSETVTPFAVDDDGGETDGGGADGTDDGTEDADDGTDDSDDGTDESDDAATTERTLQIISTGENEFEYEFVVEGTAAKSNTDTMAADSGDSVESIGSNRVRISGSTGDNSGDAFAVTGELVSAEVVGGESNFEIILGSEDITDEVTESEADGDSDTSLLTVLSTEDNQFEYEIVVDGTAAKSNTDDVAADSSDDVESAGDGTVVISGSTGDNSGDAFEITGTVEEARVIGVDSGFEIAVDGDPIDVSTSTAADGENDGTDDDGDSEDETTGLVGDESTLEILATSEEQVAYEVVVDGSAAKSNTDDVAADSSDRVEVRDDGTVLIIGTTGDNSGDAFEITGEIVSIELEGGDARLVFEGEDVTDRAD
ncbi:hypothetical protein JCM30237_23780 [Halolamina litorea]|uniref:Right-handed parallel beta-helix repeat-containing protein n=1 Tax=Halolamina litorea TaxID=1515593 RepID=A0ABD6BUY3_9EURY|nr:right-handed parallel beta-helix repeat-containing protein [Halolamina litorea]